MAKKSAKQSGIEREHDLPWNDKKVAVFKALKALGATTAASAKGAADVAKKAGVMDSQRVVIKQHFARTRYNRKSWTR